MLIDFKKHEIKFKIVYYGPGLSGKTTNIKKIYERFMGKKGQLLSIDTRGERTLFFDLLPLELPILKGYKTVFSLYTVPGQVFYKQARKLVLKGADGIIFVADSDKERLEENIAIYKEMHDTLQEFGMWSATKKLPILVQYNKRDHPDALPVSVLEEKVNLYKYPYVLAIATEGKGVFQTLQMMINEVVKTSLRQQQLHFLLQQQKK
ncbi:MAG: GTPase domain-containing protein [bacterium]|nr:GTPase domain-containing protein [bacterium]